MMLGYQASDSETAYDFFQVVFVFQSDRPTDRPTDPISGNTFDVIRKAVILICLQDYLVELFLNWSREHTNVRNMICNPSKCKELIARKKNNNIQYEKIYSVPQCNSLSLRGVTLQSVM